MTKQLYTVSLETQIIVLAEDLAEAKRAANEAIHDLSFHTDDAFKSIATPMRWFPSGWEDDSIPYGESDPADPDRTVGQWIAMGAAPQLQK